MLLPFSTLYQSQRLPCQQRGIAVALLCVRSTVKISHCRDKWTSGQGTRDKGQGTSGSWPGLLLVSRRVRIIAGGMLKPEQVRRGASPREIRRQPSVPLETQRFNGGCRACAVLSSTAREASNSDWPARRPGRDQLRRGSSH